MLVLENASYGELRLFLSAAEGDHLDLEIVALVRAFGGVAQDGLDDRPVMVDDRGILRLHRDRKRRMVAEILADALHVLNDIDPDLLQLGSRPQTRSHEKRR